MLLAVKTVVKLINSDRSVVVSFDLSTLSVLKFVPVLFEVKDGLPVLLRS